MPAEVKLQAYQDQIYRGRLRQIFPSADRAKSIVEVRVTILDADAHVKPEMTASVTFQEPKAAAARESARTEPAPPVILVPKRAVSEENGRSIVWLVTGGTAARRAVTLGPERIDQVEVKSGLVPGETVILNAPAGLTDGGLVRVKSK
jgi:multidrug efflux pump subunit AcrA (membrane-fusion protein)